MKKSAPKKSVKKTSKIKKSDDTSSIVPRVSPEELPKVMRVATGPHSSVEEPHVVPGESSLPGAITVPVTQVSGAVPEVALNASLTIDSQEEVREEPPLEKSNKRLFIIGTIVALLVVICTGIVGFYLLQQNSQLKKTDTKTTTAEATPSKAPEFTLNRSGWTLEILNGTSKAGAAGVLAEKLSGMGYVILKTGNADNKDYDTTQIFISSDKRSEDAELMLQDIKARVGVSSSSGGLTEGSASARIIIGKDSE